MRISWNSERLSALMDRVELSQPQVARATGISAPAIHAYMQGRTVPSQESMMALADFFAVPLDYLYGRCDEEQARAIQNDYAANYMALRRAPYEAYIGAGRRVLRTGTYVEYEAPWPYNLVDAIIGEPCDWVLTDDHLAALDFVMKVLNDLERAAILLYYQRGMKLEEVGREFNLTRERVRQIIRRGVRRMQTPTCIRALRVGLKTAEGTEAAEARLCELEAQIARLEKQLGERKAAVDELSAICAEIPEALTGLSTPVVDLGLSVRSTNCLWRAGYDTLGKVIDAAEDGKLKDVRNMGKKSQAEVLAMLYTKTGKDYRAANA